MARKKTPRQNKQAEKKRREMAKAVKRNAKVKDILRRALRDPSGN